ncbi:replication endonuclease [Chitinibacter sp. GC72]|uniref:replication endonuclease n=1 Tax=Chitinibacter sp. GC72 TaxID=1526917 RepID=UPI0012F744BD|nr:replication endonuclease [Chitinibacter sp. GC72]
MQLRSAVEYRQRYYQQDKWFVDKCLAKVPPAFARVIRRKHNDIVFKTEGSDTRAAAAGNILVREYRDHIESVTGKFNLAANDEEIRIQAKKVANEIISQLKFPPLTNDAKELLSRALEFSKQFDVESSDLPAIGKNGVTEETLLQRLTDEYYWRRVLRRGTARRLETEAIRLGLVNIQAGAYASDESVYRFRAQRKRNKTLLQNLQATNEAGDTFSLQDLADTSVSNPAIRRSELMTRIAGQERIARDLGHVGVFITATCPSRFHAFKRLGKKKATPNPNFDGSTPHDGQVYLSLVFARVRAALHRRGIKPFGFRVAEPHHDGCPHWHLLLFVEPEHVKTMQEIFRRYFTSEDQQELINSVSGKIKWQRRIKFIQIDWKRGSAAGYIAKYISKNIDGKQTDGESIGVTHDGFEAITAAERVQAWASIWSIRQFQPIGVAPVTLWRELRRIARQDPSVDSDILERASVAAEQGDWAEYVRILGGTGLKLCDLPLGLVRDTNLLNKYGEASTSKITGVVDRVDGDFVRSRIHEWTVEFTPMGERSELSSTRINNYTVGQIGGTPSHRELDVFAFKENQIFIPRFEQSAAGRSAAQAIRLDG